MSAVSVTESIAFLLSGCVREKGEKESLYVNNLMFFFYSASDLSAAEFLR